MNIFVNFLFNLKDHISETHSKAPTLHSPDAFLNKHKISIKRKSVCETYPFLWQFRMHTELEAQRANSSAETLSSEQVQSVLSSLQVPFTRPIA